MSSLRYFYEILTKIGTCQQTLL